MLSWKPFAAGLTTVALAACAPSTTGPSADQDGDETTLQVWSWRTEDVDAYNKMFDVFEDAHKDIKVEFRAFTNTEYDTILSTGLTEKNGPDVAQLRAYGGLQPVCEAGRLIPLEDVDVSAISGEVLEGGRCQNDGKLYGVPFATQVLAVYYNKGIFESAGLEEPTTWQEMLDAAEALKQDGITPFSVTGKDTWMLPIVHDVFAAPRYGGPEFQQALHSGAAKFTDPDYVASIRAVQELDPYFPEDVVGVDYVTSQAMFTSGKAAMFPGGSFELAFFQKQNPDLEIGVFQVPPPPGSLAAGPLTPGWVDASFGVNAKSDKAEAAKELVSWMATEEFGQMVADELKQINPVDGVTPNDPVLQEMIGFYNESPTPYLLLSDFRYGEPSGTDLMGAGIQSMLLGKEQPEQVAANLQKGISQWFEPKG
jgi:raffinose/stachyose/melibiose transport system substrate-binding protein